MTRKYVNCTKWFQAYRSPMPTSEDGTGNKKHGEEDTPYRQALWNEDDIASSYSRLRLCCCLQCLVKLQCCIASFTERSHEIFGGQELPIECVYVIVYATIALQIFNDCNILKSDDTEATVSVQVRNDVEPYQLNGFRDWKGRQVTVLNQSAFTISLTMETSF